MYQINLQTITGQSPEKKINPSYSTHTTLHRNIFSRVKKGSRSLISAFMVLTLLFLISGCDNEGIVGEGLNPSGERIITNPYDITSIEIVKDNGFSGKLGNAAMGIVDDPFYGTVTTSALIKPSINPEDLENLSADYTVKLKIELNSLKYGDENSISEYNIYEINQRWRGEEIIYNNPISFDDSNLLGSFQVSDETDIEVELDEGWVSRYREFFNSEDALRDSLYRFEFPGIALVPAHQNRKIDFIRTQRVTTEEDTTLATRFLIENDQDSLIAQIPLLDHGTSMERTNLSDDDELVLHNTLENIMKVNLDMDPEEFKGQEILNAQIVLTVDPGPNNTVPTGFTRPNTQFVRYHYFGSEPQNLASEIFVRQSPEPASSISDEQQFKVNVTGYFVDILFGETERTPLYFSNQINNGLLYSTTFYGSDAPENLRPRLIITTINPEN